MATQKEKGHDSDTPPKLQQLPGRSNNKLQGRLYKNAGRGYDRESLQKMSAGAGPALVTPLEEQENSLESKASPEKQDNLRVEKVVAHGPEQDTRKYRNDVKIYALGALLFLAGIVVGNVIIPLLTENGDSQSVSVSSKKTPIQVADNSTEVSSITSITDHVEEDKGCSIEELKEGSAGCSANVSSGMTSALSVPSTIDSITSEGSIEEAGCSIATLSGVVTQGCSVESKP